jgi:hypothetical protein
LTDIQVSINNARKNKKNMKYAHVVVLYDLVMIKIRNTVYEHFHEKTFTKVSYLERGCLDFKGNELGFRLLKRQLPHLRPIFDMVGHILE